MTSALIYHLTLKISHIVIILTTHASFDLNVLQMLCVLKLWNKTKAYACFCTTGKKSIVLTPVVTDGVTFSGVFTSCSPPSHLTPKKGIDFARSLNLSNAVFVFNNMTYDNKFKQLAIAFLGATAFFEMPLSSHFLSLSNSFSLEY